MKIMKIAYKVLKKDLTNIGLLNAPIMKYKLGVWNKPLEPISDHPRKGGGLWVAPTISSAKGYIKYLKKKTWNRCEDI